MKKRHGMGKTHGMGVYAHGMVGGIDHSNATGLGTHACLGAGSHGMCGPGHKKKRKNTHGMGYKKGK